MKEAHSEYSGFQILLNRASTVGKEFDYIADSIASAHISGEGKYTKKAGDLLKTVLGVHKVLLTTSCTHALEMSAILLDLQPGDEVIVPSYTFVTTANAFCLHGGKPTFCDIRPDTLNMDEAHVERLVNKNTQAIVPVHYGGTACEMDALVEISKRHDIRIIEDNAHGLFGKYRDRWLGTFGSLAALSFHETKNYTCGEGGALLINDPKLTGRAEIIREKGTDRNRFLKGLTDKYEWVDLGSSYLLSDMLAAFLYAQLEKWQVIMERRKRIYDRYQELLSPVADQLGLGLPQVPDHCQHSNHLFFILLPSQALRSILIRELNKQGIMTAFHYVPLHLSPMGRRLGYRDGDFPITEDISSRVLRLPFYQTLEKREQETIVTAIYDVLSKNM